MNQKREKAGIQIRIDGRLPDPISYLKKQREGKSVTMGIMLHVKIKISVFVERDLPRKMMLMSLHPMNNSKSLIYIIFWSAYLFSLLLFSYSL